MQVLPEDIAEKWENLPDEEKEAMEEAMRKLIEEQGVEIAPDLWRLFDDPKEKEAAEAQAFFQKRIGSVVGEHPEMARAFSFPRTYDHAGIGVLDVELRDGEDTIVIQPGWMAMDDEGKLKAMKSVAEYIMKNEVSPCDDCVSSITGEECDGCLENLNQ